MIQTSWTFCLTTLIHPRFVGRLYSFAFYCAYFIGLIIISHFRFLVLWPLAINEICSLIQITVWYTCRYLHWKVLSIAYVVKRFAKQIILNGNKKEGFFKMTKWPPRIWWGQEYPVHHQKDTTHAPKSRKVLVEKHFFGVLLLNLSRSSEGKLKCSGINKAVSPLGYFLNFKSLFQYKLRCLPVLLVIIYQNIILLLYL